MIPTSEVIPKTQNDPDIRDVPQVIFRSEWSKNGVLKPRPQGLRCFLKWWAGRFLRLVRHFESGEGPGNEVGGASKRNFK